MSYSKQAIELAERTSDAYSFDRFASWTACAALLLKRGYTAREAEAILRSKWMRWAGDCAEKTTYGNHTAADLERYLDNRRHMCTPLEVLKLVEGTFPGGLNDEEAARMEKLTGKKS